MSIKAHRCSRCGKLRHGEYLMLLRGADGKQYLCKECVAFRYAEARDLLTDAGRVLIEADPDLAARLAVFLAESP